MSRDPEARELEALRARAPAAEERLRSLAEHVPSLLWLAAADGRWTYVNRRRAEFTGRSPTEELEFGWMAPIHADDHDACLAAYHAAYRERVPLDTEYRLRRAAGEYRTRAAGFHYHLYHRGSPWTRIDCGSCC